MNNNDLNRNGSGYCDPTAARALKHVIAGNKINIKDMKPYEIDIAKCGWLRLVWIVSPLGFKKYEIWSNGEVIFATRFLTQAIEKYNELVS